MSLSHVEHDVSGFSEQLPLERIIEVGGTTYRISDLSAIDNIDKAPFCLRVLIENVVRRSKDNDAARAAAAAIVDATVSGSASTEIEFMPARVLFQDFTGVPVFTDFAAMRDEAAARGNDPARVNPLIPCTLVIDHSVTADVTSCSCAATENARIEAERNAERFSFLKWAASSFDNVKIVPPGIGICHQLNVERFCRVVWTDGDVAYFDTLVGTDSHTPTANGLGVLGWGVGGIEAEAAALGQPITMSVPPVVGVHLTGTLAEGVSGMDVALSFAEKLRTEGVVGCLVECFGPGVEALSVTQRTTIANMTPEYGATATYFPVDEATLAELTRFGRSEDEVALARAYLIAQGMFGSASDVVYNRVIEIDLSGIEPSLAGPSRPHDRLPVRELRSRFRAALAKQGREPEESFTIDVGGQKETVRHGAIAIAAVTSCTTATDPAMMIAAGLTAKRARELGCTVPAWVKCVLAPGSHANTEMLERAGLLKPLAELGFAVCGWGCMSCIGNSGPILDMLKPVASSCELTSVLSGNRNFEGRISPDVSQNYLCAPALVIALALAGTVDIDPSCEPLCAGSHGPVYLSDLLPSDEEIAAALVAVNLSDVYAKVSHGELTGSAAWQALPVAQGTTYAWDEASTYVRRPTFVDDVIASESFSISGGRALAVLGDFVTTDHISPAGSIAPDSPAETYLKDRGVSQGDFNSYGSRRGNHEVMMRGTFANVRLVNQMVPDLRGGWTKDPLTGETVRIFDASQTARDHKIPLVVFAGKMYGSGSSRDWAAKGPMLLGVRAVVAESFERIHRSNLIGMGIVPLQFREGESVASLGITGDEDIETSPIDFSSWGALPVETSVVLRRPNGDTSTFSVIVRVDTPTEARYLASGGILPFVLNQVLERA